VAKKTEWFVKQWQEGLNERFRQPCKLSEGWFVDSLIPSREVHQVQFDLLGEKTGPRIVGRGSRAGIGKKEKPHVRGWIWPGTTYPMIIGYGWVARIHK
jgi:hypothetical protein